MRPGFDAYYYADPFYATNPTANVYVAFEVTLLPGDRTQANRRSRPPASRRRLATPRTQPTCPRCHRLRIRLRYGAAVRTREELRSATLLGTILRAGSNRPGCFARPALLALPCDRRIS
jgi:hypothetical protein